MRVEGVVARDGDLAVRLMRDERSDYELMSVWLSDDRVLEFSDGRDDPVEFHEGKLQDEWLMRVDRAELRP